MTKFYKKPLLIAIACGSLLLGTGCADDQLAKGVVVAAGAGLGAWAGATLFPDNQMMGGVIGAGAGGVLGFMLGGMVGKN